MEKTSFIACSRCFGPVQSGIVVCDCCGEIQKLDLSMSYYTLLGMPSSFEFTEEELEKAYKKRIEKVHPDKFIQASDAEKANITIWSAGINKAYEVLKNPLENLQYWLCKEKSINEVYKPPVEFLSEIMEVEEGLNSKKDKASLEKHINKSYNKSFCLARESIKNKKYEEASQLTGQAKYWLKIAQRYNLNIGKQVK